MELTEIKGIGESRKKSFEENDIFSCEDLVNYYPYKYYNFSKTEPFQDDGNVRLIKATVIENPKIVKARGNLSFVTCKMNDEVGHTFNAVWFNQTFVKSILYLGLNVFLYGKNSPNKKNTFNVTLFKQENKMTTFGLMPVYHSISGIGQATIADSIQKALELVEIKSVINKDLLLKHNLTDLETAVKNIHNPKIEDDIVIAKNRIEIEELLPVLASNEKQKILGKSNRVYNYKNITNILNDYKSILPFELTKDQTHAINDILSDFESNFAMNRLLEGDVGSGKTAIAFFCCYLSAMNGYQSIIIAPTEILAIQHYENAKKLFKNKNIEIEILTSSTPKLQRNLVLNNIKNGEAKIIIGTHSLLSDEICFNNLSFIAIDEQHRFGVEQRARIAMKGTNPDILVMSATPIPRSLALVVYGNLKISTLLSRPKQANITTNIVIKSKQIDMWNYIKDKTQNGSKVYVVCSKIDEENENQSVLEYSAKNMFDMLSIVFGKEQVGLIHGKLKKESQEKIIENFKLGKIKVLVSTTIVEVGVDIPDSDIMVIATPERFGLSTLHQLRGRIGRNGNEAHCFCLANNLNEKSYERVNFFKSHLNGFEIAEFDLKTRGAGTMLGTNQHGTSDSLISNFSLEAYNIAKEIFEEIKSNKTQLDNLNNIAEQKLKNQNKTNIILN